MIIHLCRIRIIPIIQYIRAKIKCKNGMHLLRVGIRRSIPDSLTNLDESARIELMKKKLSVYGLADETDEFISECIAEFCNGNPRETAKTVVDILLSGKV